MYNTTIAAGGTVTLYAGNGNPAANAAGGNTISSGGTLIVGSGGNTSSDTILSGGVVSFTSGAYDTYGGETVSYGGRVIFGYGAQLSGTAATVSSGGTVEIVNGVNYGSSGVVNILEGGVVDFNAIKYSAGNTYSGVVSGNRLAAYVNGGFTAYIYLSTSAYNGQTFSGSVDAYDGGLDITICYLGGTMIRMADDSETAVEDIAIGDSVQTFVDGAETAQAVTWVGAKRQIVRAGVPDDQAGYPVRVRMGALSDGVPHKDLLVTADHCLYLDGAFVPVRMLVNGGSIDYDRSITDYTYYHVETERHAIISADGALAETYLDTGNRHGFSQPGQIVVLNSRSLDWHRDAAAPLCVDQAFVEPLHARLAQRSGTVSASPVTQADPELHLVTNDGRTIRAHRQAGRHVLFMLPAGTTGVHLRSRTARPCDTVGPFVDDRRDLGVLVGAVTLWSGDESRAVDTHLTGDHDGWAGREPGAHRWTTGDAFLPLEESMRDGALLSVEVQAGGPYLVEVNQDDVRNVA
ncbi:Hint domain-containing protein [Tanticharoenia sakaeratensis]|uniref:Hint domain-containing protein n=1 Tax=Tanticharoenia sakaeratensis TaxID=444053 RepID=UPI0006624D75|nr:Hint domain-containing protein [Tanticharoenia sakaeratensis]